MQLITSTLLTIALVGNVLAAPEPDPQLDSIMAIVNSAASQAMSDFSSFTSANPAQVSQIESAIASVKSEAPIAMSSLQGVIASATAAGGLNAVSVLNSASNAAASALGAASSRASQLVASESNITKSILAAVTGSSSTASNTGVADASLVTPEAVQMNSTGSMTTSLISSTSQGNVSINSSNAGVGPLVPSIGAAGSFFLALAAYL